MPENDDTPDAPATPQATPSSPASDNPQSKIQNPKSENTSLTPRPGHLYVVATPIGNLADITARARAILSAVDLIACEDTRTTGALLARLGLPRRDLIAYHDHNETEAADRLADQLAAGKSIAVVSDAGTPALSDPGFRIVRACRRRGIPVEPVPGACAIAAVLSASGLPTNGFLFAGFLPAKTSARTAFLEKYRDFEYTVALYESCHRIEKFVDEIVATLGSTRVICVAKEVTKLHETFLVGPASDVRARLAKIAVKGEFTLLIAPADYTLTESERPITERGLSSPHSEQRSAGIPARIFSSDQSGHECPRLGALPFFNPYEKIDRTRHQLPHWQQENVYCFVTWRLADSLPAVKLAEWRDERDIWLRLHPEPWDAATDDEYNDRFSHVIDEWLDAGHGSCLLRDPRASEIVANAIRHFDKQRYELVSFVVMPNHVHALFQPIGEHQLEDILKSWKGFSTREINRLLKRSGSLWQEDYWDRLVRSEQHLRKCCDYIENNPANLPNGDYRLYSSRTPSA